MAKICPACQAENRDEAQFCRICGTPFPLIPPDASTASGTACPECSFVNKPGVRYCAKCGVNLMGTVVVPRSQRARAPAPPPAPAYSPPTAAYPQSSYEAPSTATSPFPAGGHDAYSRTAPLDYPPAFDTLPTPDVPDPRTAIEAQREADEESMVMRPAVGVGFDAAPPPPAPRRTGLWAALGVAALVAVGVAWYFLNGATPSRRATPEVAPQPAASANEAPVEPKGAAAAASALPSAAALPASSVEAGAPLPTAETAPSTAPAGGATPAAAAPAAIASAATLPAAPVSDEERLAAERRAREKAARERAERDAKAKAAAAEREQAAARQRAEQEAAAARRAEEQQRAPTVAAPAPVAALAPAPAPRMRTVTEICAGRNFISRSMCESRECGAAEHAAEPVCRKIRENEERHRERLQ